MKIKNILITGVAGFVGSKLATKLVFKNFTVIGIDAFLYSNNSLDHLIPFKNFHLVEGDVRDKILVGDRWSTKDAPDVDDRRLSNLIESSGILDGLPTHYLDYTKDLVYNCNLINYSNRPLVTTFTGIAIMADLMKKRTIVVYDDDMVNWNNKPIMATFDAHFYKNRKSSVYYIKALDTSIL